ncbi:Inosine-5'-monophosphate dehydrogenase [Afipia felis]|jgi:CBS domain-containing protein|uniref:Inosine-5'-monophosphate dehydrogenase n=1 Tax=Afipia felis TaxID=1035 RepID=A0A090N6F0_AFIFE|nr:MULTISPECIES: CBS domain-containing protein [Afipia]EFI52671.1 putative signal transduction protein with CBS domains [Afipia sp. 1NLS2]RTL75746.1 MAG: CBS domain-containing protein [Bradyrhizobiaceae bacterium]CEG06738.1 Inosine-5'-monophosphate dehydrogenase [Afipia felis]
MRAHQVMTRNPITVTEGTSLREAALLMLENRISGLPVVDKFGKLVGIITEGDFVRRAEIGTQTRRARWLAFFVGPGRAATEFVHEQGRKVGEVMNAQPVTVTEQTSLEEIVRLMEKHNIKRLPVVRGLQLLGIVTRTDLLRTVASLDREVPDPTADDDHLQQRIVRAIQENPWRPISFGIRVRDGVVQIDGIITDERSRQASIVAAENIEGVKEVHDHLCWIEPMSGLSLLSPEDESAATRS